MMHTIAKILPLIIFYLFFSFPDEFLYVSINPLGRLIAVLILLFYSSLDLLYGIVVCFVIIFYYNLHFVEKTSMFDSHMLVGDQYKEPFNVQEKIEEFRKENCENNVLKFKNKKVKNENACHIFPDLEFLNEPCNPCDKNCGVTIQEKLNNEENISYPKTNDNWVFQIWNTWFSDEKTKPYAESLPFKMNYSKIQ
jgi:hypothetical protein